MKPYNVKPLLAAIAFALPLAAAHAESDFSTGGGALTANARVDFTIVIPKILYLRVGTGTNFADNATINLITFDVNAANVGDGAAVAATVGSGDLGTGAVTARLLGNNGDISLNVATPAGGLSNGAGDTIPYTQITTTVATLTSGTALAAPTLVNGAGTAINIPATLKVVDRDARWTYAYANANVVPVGTYGTAANGGRATYTASMP